MSLSVTQRPSQTVLNNTYPWNGVGNPILYKMQRADQTLTSIQDNGGFIQLLFFGVDITANFTIGNSLYISDDNYDLFANVTAIAYSGGDTLITVDEAYTVAGGSGLINYMTTRLNYRVEVEVYNQDDELLTSSPFIYSPSTVGLLTIDISFILRQQLNADIEADLTGSTEVFDDTEFTGFYIKYREVWTGSAESQTDDVANQFYCVLGSRQIPSTYGGNLKEYTVLPNLIGTTLGTATHSRTTAGASAGTSVNVSPDQTEIIAVRYSASANAQVGAANVVGTVLLRFELNGSVVRTDTLLNFSILAGSTVDREGNKNVNRPLLKRKRIHERLKLLKVSEGHCSNPCGCVCLCYGFEYCCHCVCPQLKPFLILEI